MTEPSRLIQETIASRVENVDPEYQRTLGAYVDNPFFDLTRVSIDEYVAKKTPREKDEQKPLDDIPVVV